MSIGTKIYTFLFGHFVGADEFENSYYCNSKDFNSVSAKRWIIFFNEIEASNIPPHWHAWLHKTTNIPPINYSHKYGWQKNHKPNLTGTSDAYFPSSYPLSKSYHHKPKTEYEKWKP